MTTVAELRDLLEHYDDDAEVRFASQPSWPFEYAINGAISSEELESGPERYAAVREDAPADSEAAGWSWAVIDSHGEREPFYAESREEAEQAAAEMNGDENEGRGPEEAPEAGVVWLVEGRQIAYASKRIFEAVQ